jgi:hypothetical protein
MRSLRVHLWIVTMSLFALAGCVSKSLEQFLHQGEVAMAERFDFASVDAFLRQVVAAHPTVDGVSLSSAHVGRQWRMAERDYPHMMRSGSWLLDDRNQKDEFSVYYELPGKRVIVVRAKRVDRSKFEEVSISLAFTVTTKC